jgi:hypothetical protein
MKMEIEKGIPLSSRRNRGNKYPWFQMQVGDSFFVQGKTNKNFSLSYARRACSPWKFESRAGLKNGKNGVRVWRTE